MTEKQAFTQIEHETVTIGRYKTDIYDIPIDTANGLVRNCPYTEGPFYLAWQRIPQIINTGIKLQEATKLPTTPQTDDNELIATDTIGKIVSAQKGKTTFVGIRGAWVTQGFQEEHDIDIVYYTNPPTDKPKVAQLIEGICNASLNIDHCPLADTDPLLELSPTRPLNTRGLQIYKRDITPKDNPLDQADPKDSKLLDISLVDPSSTVTPAEILIKTSITKRHVIKQEQIPTVLYEFKGGKLTSIKMLFTCETSEHTENEPLIIPNDPELMPAEIITADICKLVKDVAMLVADPSNSKFSLSELVSTEVLSEIREYIDSLVPNPFDYTGFDTESILAKRDTIPIIYFRELFAQAFSPVFSMLYGEWLYNPERHFPFIQDRAERRQVYDMSVSGVAKAIRYLTYLEKISKYFDNASDVSENTRLFQELFYTLGIPILCDKLLPQHALGTKRWSAVNVDFYNLTNLIGLIKPQSYSQRATIENWSTDILAVFFPLAQATAFAIPSDKIPLIVRELTEIGHQFKAIDERTGYFTIAKLGNFTILDLIPKPDERTIRKEIEQIKIQNPALYEEIALTLIAARSSRGRTALNKLIKDFPAIRDFLKTHSLQELIKIFIKPDSINYVISNA